MKLMKLMKLEMKQMKSLALSLAVTLTFAAIPAVAQAACSVQTPCTTVNITNSTMSATVVTNAQGVQISGPGTANAWRCTGPAATTCAASTWGTAVWTNLTASAPVPQTSSSASYVDPTVAYGTVYNYIVTNTWTGGGTSLPSVPFVFAMPAAPSTVPSSATVVVVLKTS